MNRDALIRLRDAVKAGEWDQSAAWKSFGISKTNRAERAHHGSLDAAKALHEAVLPGWAVDDMSQNGNLAGHPWGIRLAHWNTTRPDKNQHVSAGWGNDDLPSNNPARAWLLAVLEALIAETPE